MIDDVVPLHTSHMPDIGKEVRFFAPFSNAVIIKLSNLIFSINMIYMLNSLFPILLKIKLIAI